MGVALANRARTLLLVDDDPHVRIGIDILLEMFGYETLTAEDGPAALKVLQEQTTVDCMVVDYAMPGMNGTALIEKARELFPGLPVLLMSGYDVRSGDIPGGRILRKPFNPEDLERELCSLLEDRT